MGESVFQSVEFYVIATLVASTIVAFAMKPSARGEARQYLLAGTLLRCDVNDAEIELESMDDYNVRLVRRGTPDVTEDGAISLAVTVIGTDITIEERIVFGRRPAETVDTAVFNLDFLGAERYHIQYKSDATGLFAATTFNNNPGYHVIKQLSR